jgi:hypothetical protein
MFDHPRVRLHRAKQRTDSASAMLRASWFWSNSAASFPAFPPLHPSNISTTATS